MVSIYSSKAPLHYLAEKSEWECAASAKPAFLSGNWWCGEHYRSCSTLGCVLRSDKTQHVLARPDWDGLDKTRADDQTDVRFGCDGRPGSAHAKVMFAVRSIFVVQTQRGLGGSKNGWGNAPSPALSRATSAVDGPIPILRTKVQLHVRYASSRMPPC